MIEQVKFEKLRIVSSNYKITYHKQVILNGRSLEGCIIESKKLIQIVESLNYQYKLQVIFHEAMHGIELEMEFNKENEESRVIQLTTGISCFLRDNPGFIMKYIEVLNDKGGR